MKHLLSRNPGYADYIMYSTFLTDSSGSVLFSSSAHLEELLHQFEAVESDDTNTTDTDIHTALQCLCVDIEHTKNMLDDYAQKWRHTPEQFETNRLVARAQNTHDDSINGGPDGSSMG